MAQENPNCSNKLNETVNRTEIDEKSHEFLRHLHSFITGYQGQLPNLRDIFRTEAIEWLLTQSVRSNVIESTRFINFVIDTGYKDVPEVDENGKNLSRRTTPVHHVPRSGRYSNCVIPDRLFKIYDKFDVNYSDENGLTHFHVACQCDCTDAVEKFLDLGQDPDLLVPKTGESPLHLAVRDDSEQVFKLLLERGANPNSANDEGQTPLHYIIIYQRYRDENCAMTLFEICEEQHRSVKLDARDKQGRTPLELAATNMLPNTVNFLLNNGADLSSFVFPTASDVDEELQYEEFDFNFQYDLASGAMACVEQLEKRGYELKRRDALTIMKLFKSNRLFEKPKDTVKRWYDRKSFAMEAKKLSMKPSLSLYDFVRLRPEEATKLMTYQDHYELAKSCKLWLNLSENDGKACCLHLCEMVSRKFFRRWALEHFMELTRYRLPILCSEMIIKQLMNQDLRRICLANCKGRSS